MTHRLRSLLLLSPLLLAALLLLTVLHTSAAAFPLRSSSWFFVDSPPLPVADSAALSPSLLKALSSASPTSLLPILIQWKTQPYDQLIAARLPSASARTPTARLQQRTQVIQLLQDNANLQSAQLQIAIAAADQQGQASQVTAYWISPILSAQATPALIQTLSQRPDVVQIRLDTPLPLTQIPFTSAPSASSPLSAALPWDLSLMQVDLAQSALHLDGTGVVVANIDTGVDWQHPALLTHYRGYNPHGPANHAGNWYVVTGEPYLYPGDSNGHGTHTMGTMLGDDGAGNRTGVAPGARWIAVKIFNNQNLTYESWIHAAFQWIIAPDGNPALAPDIVNNSWGSDASNDDRYRPDVSALLSAGILPVFSAGNAGPDPATVGSPASYPESLSVGAVDQESLLASFSSRGPSPWQEIKPEIVAPGVNIRSTFPGGGYAYGTGTSMAAPHIAGLAALLLQANPALTPSEIRTILKSSAQPLGAVIPNNNTGWGLANAYTAALQVIPNGILKGSVTSAATAPASAPVPYPSLSARLLGSPTQGLTLTGQVDGSFELALLPGQYDVSAWGFGFEPLTLHDLTILTGTTTTRSFLLTPLLSGLLTGAVTDLSTGAPLSATLTISGTWLKTQTNPVTGIYTFTLPAGDWTVQALSERHKIARSPITIPAPSGLPAHTLLNFSLTSAPRILLVDAGRWYYGSQIGYLTGALSALDLPYTLWPIRSLGLAGTPDERPVPGSFNGYDVVIWSDPQSSPGWINASPTLIDYLTHSNGHLLLTGQDILFLDGGGTIFNYPYLIPYLGAKFSREQDPASLTGLPHSLFDGFSLALNTPDSARQQTNPDAAAITDPLYSQAVLAWPDGSPGTVTTSVCRPYRLAWLGFGLEGAGPKPARIQTLNTLLDWFDNPPTPYGFVLHYSKTPAIGAPSQVLTQTIQIISTGADADLLNVTVQGGPWPIDLSLSGGTHFQSSASLPLPSCKTLNLTVSITIPASAPSNFSSIHTLTFTSQNDPAHTQVITLTTKTPAPILVVDHQRFYHQLAPYTQSLADLGLSFDIYNAFDLVPLPSAKELSAYPLVIWTAGYNWFDPLGRSNSQVDMLASYLDGGGRLLVSGQDILDVSGDTNLVRQRFGIASSLLTITTTEVAGAGATGSPFGRDFGPWNLHFIYHNWSDGLSLAPSAYPLLRDQNLHTVGALQPGPQSAWRTAFFSFPLETLDPQSFQTSLAGTTLWLSPFGGSQLIVPPVAASGGTLPIRLLLRLANPTPLASLQASLPLPAGVELIPGSLQGPWSYDPAASTLTWQGQLTPGQTLVLSAQLQIAAGAPSGSQMLLRARLTAPNGLTVVCQSPVLIDAPWLQIKTQVDQRSARPENISFFGNTAQPGATPVFTVTLSNTGLVSSTAHLTATLPAGLTLITSTLTTAQSGLTNPGSLSTQHNLILWTGALQPRDKIYITYSARVTTKATGLHLNTRYDLVGPGAHRLSWIELLIPRWLYFPLIGR